MTDKDSMSSRLPYIKLLLVFFFLLKATLSFSAGYYNTMFAKSKSAANLSFTTMAQSIFAYNCSNAVTVTHRVGTIPTNVSSPLTVNLSSTAGSVTFYSDADCTTPITSVSILAGTNSGTFYFLGSSATSTTVSASAVSFTTAQQTETLTTNPFIWTGSAGSSWATAGNWSGGAVPGAGDVAVFNSTCAACPVSITANMSVGGVRIISGYSGAITQGTGLTVTIGSKGWIQSGGSYLGSDGNITLNGPMIVSAGSFRSTSGTLTQGGAYTKWMFYGSGSFTHNSGSVVFGTSAYMVFNSSSYNNVTFGGFNLTYDLNTTNMIIDGNLTLSSTSTSPQSQINNGTLSVAKNVSVLNEGASGTALVKLTGNAAGQTIAGSTASGRIPHLEIAAGTNPVTLSNKIITGTYKMTSAGTFSAFGSTLEILQGGTITPGTKNYWNVILGGYAATYDLGGATFNVGGNLTLNSNTSSPISSLNNGTVNVTGSIYLNNNGMLGNSTIKLLESGLAGRVIDSVNYAFVPNLEIDIGADYLTIQGTLSLASYIVTTATDISASTATMRFARGGTIKPDIFRFQDVEFYGYVADYTLSGTLYVDGNLTFNSQSYSPVSKIDGGIIELAGNLIATNGGADGTVGVTFTNPTFDQTISQSSGAVLPSGPVAFSLVRYLSLLTDVTWNKSLSFTGGSGIKMNGKNLTLTGLALGGRTVTKGGGTLTVGGSVAGTGALYGGTVNP